MKGVSARYDLCRVKIKVNPGSPIAARVIPGNFDTGKNLKVLLADLYAKGAFS